MNARAFAERETERVVRVKPCVAGVKKGRGSKAWIDGGGLFLLLYLFPLFACIEGSACLALGNVSNAGIISLSRA